MAYNLQMRKVRVTLLVDGKLQDNAPVIGMYVNGSDGSITLLERELNNLLQRAAGASYGQMRGFAEALGLEDFGLDKYSSWVKAHVFGNIDLSVLSQGMPLNTPAQMAFASKEIARTVTETAGALVNMLSPRLAAICADEPEQDTVGKTNVGITRQEDSAFSIGRATAAVVCPDAPGVVLEFSCEYHEENVDGKGPIRSAGDLIQDQMCRILGRKESIYRNEAVRLLNETAYVDATAADMAIHFGFRSQAEQCAKLRTSLREKGLIDFRLELQKFERLHRESKENFAAFSDMHARRYQHSLVTGITDLLEAAMRSNGTLHPNGLIHA